jgi:hypothetical protein
MPERGRGDNTSRGRSTSRRGGRGGRNFFSRQVAEEQTAADNRESENIRANRTRAQNATPTSPSVISTTVDKGKKFISTFFNGFTSEKRSNIQVTLDNSFPTRIATPYADSIEEFVYSEHKLDPDDTKSKRYFKQLIGISHVATATKLHRSSPVNEKTANSTISALNSEIRLPNKMGTLIDQVGKTDLPNDNRIRIDGQHLAAKQHLIRGMYFYYGKKLKDFINDNVDINYGFIEEIVKDMDKLKCLVDNKPISVDYLKVYGRRRFEEVSKQNFSFTINDSTYEFRIPNFDFDRDLSPNDIKEYLSNSVFFDFHWTGKELNKMLGSLVLQVAKPSWLRNSGKKMKQLDGAFENTAIEDLTFATIMMAANIYNINWIFSDDDINNITIDLINHWNSSLAPKFSKILNMTDFKFSEFGTDSQLVHLEEEPTKKKNQFNVTQFRFTGKNKATTMLKTTEHGAIMGIMGGFTSLVEIENNININFNSNNDNILKEYVRSDFIIKL